jgi:hypothetical protein
VKIAVSTFTVILCPTSNNEKLHNLYSLPNIITMIQSRRITWADHLACMGGNINAYKGVA